MTTTAVITKEWLSSKEVKPCKDQLAIFKAHWPNGMEVTAENLRECQELRLDVAWVIARLLPVPYWEQYLKDITPYWEQYQKDITPYWEQYKKDIISSGEQYQKDITPFLEQYQKGIAPVQAKIIARYFSEIGF